MGLCDSVNYASRCAAGRPGSVGHDASSTDHLGFLQAYLGLASMSAGPHRFLCNRGRCEAKSGLEATQNR